MYLPTLLTSFQTSDNLTLPGILFLPEEKTTKVVISLHGNGSSNVFDNITSNEAYSRRFTQKGIAYFNFNNRGAGVIKRFRIMNKENEKVIIDGGCAYEVIKDCVLDIDGAVDFLQTLGFTDFILAGFSTGANKVVVYNHYKPSNVFSHYVLLAGGDDTGITYEMLGKEVFLALLEEAKQKIQEKNGNALIPVNKNPGQPLSYQSYFDMCNPDGDYNTFPYREYFRKLDLSKKQPLFSQFSEIQKPTSVIYGALDEYSWSNQNEIEAVLLQKAHKKALLHIHFIPNGDHGFSQQYDLVLDDILYDLGY